MTTFIHTADWQLGKPFAGVEDAHKRSLLHQERLNAIDRIGHAVREHHAAFVLVAGDLFDSPSVTKPIVSAACSKIGALRVPVYAIPGNHDHGGPAGLWEQPFFRSERDQLAPNLQVLLQPEPLDIGDAVLFPCPLLRRHESSDLTSWLRTPGAWDERFGSKPRIVLAHGSVQGFGSQADDEDGSGEIANFVDVERLPSGEYDYIALGDWHGTKQVGPKAWFSGTHEIDRFPKGGDHDPGNILVVSVDRAGAAVVKPVRTTRMAWHVEAFTFVDDAGVSQLATRLIDLLGARINQDLLRFSLSGSLGLEATAQRHLW